MTSVIVFGPTGNIGSVAARTAAEHGAKVTLAMRDTNKTIPGLSKEEEKSGNFTRVQADLHKPETVAEAIKTSGAKRAYFYLAFGSSDHMKSTIEAMKSAGLELPIFLSSFTVPSETPLRDVSPTEIIDYLHSQVEANLDDVYGPDNYVAIRPGFFALNIVQYHAKDVAKGEMRMYGGDFKQDLITPGDMGRVGGALLAFGPKNGQRKVYLYGPQMIPARHVAVELSVALSRPLQITQIDAEEGVKQYVDSGLPQPLAEYLMRKFDEAQAPYPRYEEGVENVKLYTGRSSKPFHEWVKENKELFGP